MSQDDDVERVARALAATWRARVKDPNWPGDLLASEFDDLARAALSAMPQRLSPELIAQLNKLATYLTEQGEYEACDLIDTVVERVTAMPGRELLAEALEALTPFAKHAEVQFAKHLPPHVASDDATPVWGNSWDDDGDVTVGDLRRARAAADKIRVSLTQEPQT